MKLLTVLLNILVCCILKTLTTSGQVREEVSQTSNNPCDIRLYWNETVVDCSNRSLQCIANRWFPENTSELMLQYNVLTVIPNNALNNLYQLKRLHLQYNLLTYIQPRAFEGLICLQYLNLENNYLNLFNLPFDIFKDLIVLTELRLIQSVESIRKIDCLNISCDQSNNASFPDGMFSTLDNLTTLSVSVSGQVLYFNKDFTRLQKLTRLEITGSVKVINETSFQNIPTIENLWMFKLSDIRNISDLVLGRFSNVGYITYLHIPIGLHSALDTLRPLVNTNVRLISFETVQKVPGLKYVSIMTKDGFLDATITKYLRQICVEELHLIRNSIFVIEYGTFGGETMNRCLKSIYLIYNPLMGTIMAATQGLTLQNLHTLVITGSFVRENGLDATRKNEINSKVTNITRFVNYNNFNTKDVFISQSKIIVHISKSIEYLDMSSIFGESRVNIPISILGGENLKYIRLVDDGIQLVEYPVEGLPNLKGFELSFNKMTILSPDFFNAYPSLETLILDNCRLSSYFVSQHSSRMFQNLSKLQNLDLSYNSLEILEPNTFFANPSLKTLTISGNRFKYIPFDLNLTPRLQHLDIRDNVLTSISKQDLQMIEENRIRAGDFQLLLSGNILSCGCENVQFLQWLHLTQIQLDNNRNFTCMDNQGVLSYTLAYVDLDGLWRECWGQFFFNISLGLLCLNLIGFLLLFVWTKNKILIQSRLLLIFTGLKYNTRGDYTYGVFIGYSDLDYQFACFSLRQFIESDLGLKTFLQDRDLSPSLAYADGIMEAINSSWRVLLLINENFMNQNEWFLFTIRSAIYSISPANPMRVVILVDENCLHSLPTELLSSIPENNVVVVSEWQMNYELSQALKTRLL